MAKSTGFVGVLEDFVFTKRIPILIVLLAFTLFMGYMASKIRPDAGFEKQVPLQHDYMSAYLDFGPKIGTCGEQKDALIRKKMEGTQKLSEAEQAEERADAVEDAEDERVKCQQAEDAKEKAARLRWFQEIDRAGDFSASNNVLIAVFTKDGKEIYNQKFISILGKITDVVNTNIDSVDRASIESIWTPNVRWTEVTAEGFNGDTVMPSTYLPDQPAKLDKEGNVIKEEVIFQPSQELLEQVKSNVSKANILGRLVTNKQDGAMVSFSVLPINKNTQEKTRYEEVGQQLEERIRDEFGGDVSIHMIGFTKVVHDIVSAIPTVGIFFGITVLLASVLLYIYCGSLKLTVLPIICSFVAVIWQFGLLVWFGFGIDPMGILVPFLVFAIGVSHGVQMVNSYMETIIEPGNSPEDAARLTFSRLLVPASVALVSDTVGFATILFIPIGTIFEMGLSASMGVGIIIVTNLLLMPILLSFVKIRDIEGYSVKVKAREGFGQGLWVSLSKLTERGPAIVVLLIAGALFAVGTWKGADVAIGDLEAGVPELAKDSRFNQDVDKIVNNFAIGVDRIQVIAEVESSACVRQDIMANIERLGWYLENEPGVQSVISLAHISRLVNRAFSNTNPKATDVPRERPKMVAATGQIKPETGLLNQDCSAMPVMIFTADHKAGTIKHIVSKIKDYNDKYGYTTPTAAERTLKSEAEVKSINESYIKKMVDREVARLAKNRNIADEDEEGLKKIAEEVKPQIVEDYEEVEVGDVIAENVSDKDPEAHIRFRLATANVGVMAATNEVVEEKQLPIVYTVYAVIIALCFVMFMVQFRSIPMTIASTICVVAPLALVSALGYAVMVILGIGLKVSTLPVVALGVGIGVDYGIYIFGTMGNLMNQGRTLREAYHETLQMTGKAVLFTAVTLGIGVFTWVFSDLQFQADMGMMLCYMFIVNMLAAVLVLPALAHFLIGPIVKRRQAKEAAAA